MCMLTGRCLLTLHEARGGRLAPQSCGNGGGGVTGVCGGWGGGEVVYVTMCATGLEMQLIV